MVRRKSAALLGAATLTCVGLVGAAGPATAAPTARAETPATVTVVTSGLKGPRQISAYGNRLYVAESDANQVSFARKGTDRPNYVVVKDAAAAQGVVRVGHKIYVASGSPDPEGDNAPPEPNTRLLVAKPFGKARTFANLLTYEKKYNPDNQTQGDTDALSNPYYVIKRHGGGLLVADAGANDVLAVTKKGKVSTFFVPPSVTTGPCAEATDQNSDAGPSCDAVPTGLAYGPNGHLYVSALTALAPGEGRVYEVDKNRKLISTLTGFSGPTGVAVDRAGNVYVSELLQGVDLGGGEAAASARAARAATARRAADADEPDPGQIVKVAADSARTRTYAQVTLPSGLLWEGGKLYASALSLVPDQGQVVVVDPSSFLPE